MCTAWTVKVCNGCHKDYYQTPVLFNDEQNTVVVCLPFWPLFWPFLAKNTPNFPAQYRIDHLSIENKSDTVCTVNFVATFHVLTWCYNIDGSDCKKSQVVSILHNEFRKKKKSEKMIISSFLGPPNKR